MKTTLLLLAICLGATIHAQDGYQFTLIQNSPYNYSVKAVANFTSVMGSDPDLESFAFAIMLQDGASIDESTLVLPYGTLDGGTIAVNSAAVLDAADPGNDRSSNRIAISSGSNLGFPGHNTGDQITIATFDILGTPTTGDISILDNGSSLAMAAGSTLDSFINADTTGGNNAIASYYGQTGTVAYSFSTLSTVENELIGVSIFPNPTSDYIHINTTKTINKVELYDLLGKLVLQTIETNKIKVNQLPQGVYLIRVFVDAKAITKKIVIK